jgi:hypothetical protein
VERVWQGESDQRGRIARVGMVMSKSRTWLGIDLFVLKFYVTGAASLIVVR